jgi:hypothetical protein
MRFNPVAFMKDPATRPRAIIWIGVALIVFTVVWAAALDGTSTYWFCTEPCHIVHADNTLAYQESSHTNVSCIACHEPVNASPLTLTLLKISVAPDAFETIGRTFELPMNATNYVALEMPSAQCTQCHNLNNRVASPDDGILIDHAVHEKNDIRCTLCHNRVAHPEEDIKLVLKGDRKHDDWMTMDGCFRCHSQEKKDAKTPPGECKACHTPDFELKPASHDSGQWYKLFGDSTGHAEEAKEESKTVEEALALADEHAGELSKDAAEKLVPSSAVNSCFTCHAPSYCSSCHGLDMPHSAVFAKDHSKQGYGSPAVCAKCHARTPEEAKGTGFCNACHHPESTPGKQWAYQHPGIVRSNGGAACYDCHDETQCAYCHVNGIDKFRAIEDQLW